MHYGNRVDMRLTRVEDDDFAPSLFDDGGPRRIHVNRPDVAPTVDRDDIFNCLRVPVHHSDAAIGGVEQSISGGKTGA